MKKTFGILLICIGSIVILVNLSAMPDFIGMLYNAIRLNNENVWGHLFGSIIGTMLIFILGFLPLIFGVKLVRKSKKV